MSDSPSLTSGRRGVKDPVVENLNVLVSGNPLRYHFIKHSLKVPARLTRHDMEGEGINLGFDVRAVGAEEGTIDLQLDKATDALPLPAHILRKTIGSVVKYFGVTDGSQPVERNSVIRISPSLLQIINPFFKGLLSQDLGDTLQASYSKATVTTSTTATLDPQPVNTRTGATLAYAATQEDGSALPAGVTISPTTGVITLTGAALVIGTYTIKVSMTDLITTLPANHPWTTLAAEQTLILTIAT